MSDSDVRNAISHGGIIYNGNSLRFQFTQGNISGNKEVSTYQFKTDIKEILILLVACVYLGYTIYKTIYHL